MSPFDELMAQHAQQLQRERTLLRMNKTNNVSGQHAGGHTSHHHNTEQVRSKSAGGNHPVDDQIPPIPPPPVSSKIDDIVPHHLAEPPFEYSTPAMSDLPKKSLSENTAEIKKGLLSSILEKVKSKEEAESQISRNNKRLLTASAPLASSESLSVSDTSTKRMSATSSNLESTTSSMPNPTVVLKFRNVCALFGKIWHFLRFRIQKPFLKYFSKLNELFLASEPLHFAIL